MTEPSQWDHSVLKCRKCGSNRLTVPDHSTDDSIEFYKRAFGDEEIMSMKGPGGKIRHAELKIGDSVIFLADSFRQPVARHPRHWVVQAAP